MKLFFIFLSNIKLLMTGKIENKAHIKTDSSISKNKDSGTYARKKLFYLRLSLQFASYHNFTEM